MFNLNPDYFKKLTNLKTGDLPLLIATQSEAGKVVDKILSEESLPQILNQVDELLGLMASNNTPRVESLSTEDIHDEYVKNRMVIEKLISLTKKDPHAR